MSSETIPEYSERVNSMYSSLNIECIIIKLEIIIDELDIHFDKAKNLILDLARELDESKLCKQSQICRKIKEFLEDKIKEGKISDASYFAFFDLPSYRQSMHFLQVDINISISIF